MKNPFKNLFFGLKKSVAESLPEIEESLLEADVGVATAEFLINALKNSKVKTPEEATLFLKNQVRDLLQTPVSQTPVSQTPVSMTSVMRFPVHRPGVFLFLGVNGVGKTTSIAKLANYFLKQGLSRGLLVAGDTFRAAAVEQLKTWGNRLGLETIAGQNNADPASVVFDGLPAAKNRQVDFVLVDTSGRLQTKSHLMEELKKILRISEKALQRPVDEIFLVLDATTGQNGLSQALLFKEATNITGLVLTKLDSRAKGGVVLSIVRQTGLPVRFIGFGESIDDWQPFDATKFAEELFS